MDWKTRLEELCGGQAGLLTVATTGLKPDDGDTVIGVSWITRDSGKEESGHLLALTDNELLLKSQEYHRITQDQLDKSGLDEEEFEDAVRAQLYGRVWLTYNLKFQQSFLEKILPEVTLVDLPLIVKAIESEMLADQESIEDVQREAEKLIGKAPGFSGMCKRRGIEADPPAGILPMDWNCVSLKKMLDQLSRFQCR